MIFKISLTIFLILTNCYGYLTTKANGGFSNSADASRSSSDTTTYNNSKLNFKNLNVQTSNDTTIAGANIKVEETLNMDVKGDLTVKSMQNTNKTNSNSASIGTSNGSLSFSKEKSKETLQSSIIANSATINVENNTHLEGATLATQNQDGEQTDNLNLTTNTLTHKNLSNTTNSRSISLGGSTGSTVSGNVALGNQNSKSKTLATLGEGSINVKDTQNSDDISKLNRDSTDTTRELYDIKRDVEVSAEVDTRMLSKEGRADIANDIKKSKVGFVDVASDIITKESIDILDAFTHQGNKVDFYNGVKDAIKNDKDLQDKLSNPDLTQEQKDEVLKEVAQSVANELKIELSDVSTISTNVKTEDGKEIKGGYHAKSNDIAINDKNSKSTGDTLNTLGHEITHAMDNQRGTQREGTTSSGESYSDEYANTMGDSLEDYANFAIENHSDKSLAKTNSHIGLNPNSDTSSAKSKFESRNKDGEIQHDTDLIVPAVIAVGTAVAKGVKKVKQWSTKKPDKGDDVVKKDDKTNYQQYAEKESQIITQSTKDKSDSLYGHIKDPKNVGEGKNFTAKQKKQIIDSNIQRNSGTLRDDITGEKLVKSKKSKKGVKPPENEAQVDHIVAKKPPKETSSAAGTNSNTNAQVLSRKNNREKSNK
jgi:filamentous hemagglutinin